MVLLYLCVMKVQLQGILSGVSQAASCSACQYMTPSWLSVAHKLQPLTSAFCLLLLKIKIFFFFLLSFKKAVSPAAQQLCNKEVCQVMSDQTNDGWPTLHACTVHSGVSVFKKKIWKREFVSHKKSILGLKKRLVNSETFGEQLLSGSDVEKRSLCFEFRVAQFYAHSCLRDFRMML